MFQKSPLLFTLLAAFILVFSIYMMFEKNSNSENDITYNNQDQYNFALAIYWEAKFENDLGKKAVAHVILNRVRHQEFPNTITGVISQGGRSRPCQFDFYCNGKSDKPTEKENWEASQKVAEEVLQDMKNDPTKGALFFHTKKIKNPFSKKRKYIKTIGNNVFYK